MSNCPTCGAPEAHQGDHFQVGHCYQKDDTREPGGCLAVLSLITSATFGAVLIVEDENGVFGIPTMSVTDGYHEVDWETWISNMSKVYEWREKTNQEVTNRILRPRLFVPGSRN